MDTNTRIPERPKPIVQGEPEKSRIDVRDVMVVVGFVMLAGGLGGYDWRLAAVVCGTVLLAMGLWMAARA